CSSCAFTVLFLFVEPLLLCPHIFPYTTLFRSQRLVRQQRRRGEREPGRPVGAGAGVGLGAFAPDRHEADAALLHDDVARPRLARSEEHTSELQSRENLVCRLLLEKKKTSTVL